MNSAAFGILEELARLQNSAAQSVASRKLGHAHRKLKSATMLLFENTGPSDAFEIGQAIRIYMTLFRAAYYLERRDGRYAYRYEAIPGQFGNACHFQLALSPLDASGYHPSEEAVRSCARAAHSLLEQHARWVILQSQSDREQRRGRLFSLSEVEFCLDELGYPILTPRSGHAGDLVDFRQARRFDWELFQSQSGIRRADEETTLRHIESSMRLLDCA